MQMKVLLLSGGLKLSNSKPGYHNSTLSALHFFVKIGTTKWISDNELNQTGVLFFSFLVHMRFIRSGQF